jgi:anti-sigma B factor antagonist
LKIQREMDGGILILSLSGEFDDAGVGSFMAEISDALEAGCVRVLLDLSEIGFINATALGALVTTQRRLAGLGGGIAVAEAQPVVDQTLMILRLDEGITMYRHLEDARTHLKNLDVESPGTTGDDVAFFCPDAGEQFGPRPRWGRLVRMHDQGLTFEFKNIDGLNVEETFPTGARVEIRCMLPLYHPTEEFEAIGSVDGIERFRPAGVCVHVWIKPIS